MAFFMLMWLLNATTEEQRKGIADYFSPRIPVSRTSSGADGLFGGNNLDSRDTLSQDGTGRAHADGGQESFAPHDSAEAAEAAAAEAAALRAIEDALLGRGGESPLSDLALRHVVTRMTDEGLVIEIFALPGAPIFAPDTAEPLALTVGIVGAVARVAGMVTNPVAVGAHVPARPVILADSPVWTLSNARADAARRMLESGGFDPARVQRVTGFADREPAVDNRLSERNDRITFTILRRRY
jgi:chemotaxis protein MotB